jgi:hypothetical protein
MSQYNKAKNYRPGRWVQGEIDALKHYDVLGLSDKEISNKLQRSIAQVRDKRHNLKISTLLHSFNKYQKKTKEEWQSENPDFEGFYFSDTRNKTNNAN